MRTLRALFRSAIAALCITGSSPVFAMEQQAPFVVAAADCYAIGQQVAAENGGTLAKASQSDQGGQAVCVIVILVPGKDGQRPRRQEFVVPQN